MLRDFLGMTFAKYIGKVMIFFGNTTEVNRIGSRCGTGVNLGSGQLKTVHFGARELTSAYKCRSPNK